ncbi:hypothetical protein [Brevundimonas intermedia]|uniref:hypothetical protein n=1 Tax=Brevundimonas intermedia TaxID=74315 RepID=UPI00320B2755
MGPVHYHILEMLTEGQAYWAGSRPPLSTMSCSTALYDPEGDFRAPPILHQTFALVYVVERDLGRIKQWPLVLDEALRLLKPGGILRVRFSESALLSVFQFANFLQKWTGGALELISQARRVSDYEFSVRLTHNVPRESRLTALAFAIVTDGRKPAAVRNFVDSVRKACAMCDTPYEILVCGPLSVTDDFGSDSDVRVVKQPETFSEFGWISEKKNLLVDAATAPIIVITHDRYEVPEGFVEALEAFGADFDVLVPRQITTDGDPLPDWVTLSDELNWTTPAWMQHGDYHPYVYANGGAIIARTSLLRRVRWSPLLFWGQGEDVDLSRRLSDAGAVLRFSRNVTLVSAPTRAGFVEGFERLPWRDEFYAQAAPTPGIVRRGPLGVDRAPTPPAFTEEDIHLEDIGPEDVASFGFVFSRAWRQSSEGMALDRAAQGTSKWISFRLPDRGGGYSLYLERAFGSLSELVVNGVRCEASGSQDGYIRVELPNTVWWKSRIIHITVPPLGSDNLVLRRIRLECDDRRMALDRTLLFTPKTPEIQWLERGWKPSPEGARMTSPRSLMILRFPQRPASTLKGIVEMAPYEAGAAFVAQILVDGAKVANLSSASGGGLVQFLVPRPSGRTISVEFVLQPEQVRKGFPILTRMRWVGVK